MLNIESQILYEGYDIMAEWAAGLLVTPINVMYMEYENVSGPSEEPTPVTINLHEGKSYYESLAGGGSSMFAGGRDFLRVPILVQPTTLSTGQGYQGNAALFLAMSNAIQGLGGQPFSDLQFSKVTGVALVVAEDPDDWTRDRVFARGYFSPSIPKAADNQISIQWTQRFEDESVVLESSSSS